MDLPFETRDATPDDLDLIWEIQNEAIGPHVRRELGVTAEEHQSHFYEHFNVDGYVLVLDEGIEVGMLKWVIRESDVYLENGVLLPDYQGRGIGSAVIRLLLSEAASRGLPARLQVFKSNPAHKLYERLGFEVESETDHHLLMVARP